MMPLSINTFVLKMLPGHADTAFNVISIIYYAFFYAVIAWLICDRILPDSPIQKFWKLFSNKIHQNSNFQPVNHYP